MQKGIIAASLKTKMELMLYKVFGVSALLVLSGYRVKGNQEFW